MNLADASKDALTSTEIETETEADTSKGASKDALTSTETETETEIGIATEGAADVAVAAAVLEDVADAISGGDGKSEILPLLKSRIGSFFFINYPSCFFL